MKVKDILKIDLNEEIKNVIDLEDISETEIKNEIENYIVTEGLAKHFENFVSIYLSEQMPETGVWISGFYGSGKSYFGKMLGYMLSNRKICGTPARDRILQRFTGIEGESLIKNTISGLSAVKSRVIFMDIAKQNTKKGFAYTLFRNFLRSLDIPGNEHGFLLFQLMIDNEESDVRNFVNSRLDENWDTKKSSLTACAELIQQLYMQEGKSEEAYENIMETIRREIDEFSPEKLRDQLRSYLQINRDEKIVFLFDEASEAINQKKFTLLDLEGISEALSSLGSRVWTIAIAQEKLDDVINNTNVSKAQLTKVTDRFKTKIHLEATEVDYIIKNRLLNKKEDCIENLKNYFERNAGKISDHSSLTGAGIAKTDSSDTYLTYYPFYKYQFNLMQNFLFGTKGYVSTRVAARGMIITTFDILRREVKDQELYKTVTGWQITKQAQPTPDVRLVNRYDNAENILKENNSRISGRKLLETINFLYESEVTPANLSNIIKSYISSPDEYHIVKEDIEKALKLLLEGKILLMSNGAYRITSDIEQRLLDEMNTFHVQIFNKKKNYHTNLHPKSSDFIKTISRVIDNSLSYDFYITTDNEEELTAPQNKHLQLKIKSIYNISDNRTNDIETIRAQYQNSKDVIWLLPDNSDFAEIDNLIEEVERISYLEQKYNNPDSEEGKILLSFSTAKNEKENRIKHLIEKSLKNGELIYLFNVVKLNESNAKSLTLEKQKELIQNVYTKRLESQLSDSVAKAVITETDNKRLHSYFHSDDFKFFDTSGNFIGDNLKVTDEILDKIRNTFVDGKTLETELESPPTGFSLGTVMSALAVLMRAGKVIAKYNGQDKFSWKDNGVREIFSSAREFRKASFKAVTKSISLTDKQTIIQTLLSLQPEKYINKKIDYNTNDFDLANIIRELANSFSNKIATLKNSKKEFVRLFPDVQQYADTLKNFTGTVSENNYIDIAKTFLSEKSSYSEAVKQVLKIEKFIRNKLPNVKQWRNFVTAVGDELKKAAKQDENLQTLINEFNKIYSDNIVDKYAELQQIAQKVKDRYHQLFSEAMGECAAKYSEIKNMAQKLIDTIDSLPKETEEFNIRIKQTAQNLLRYAEQRANKRIELEFDVKDKINSFTYSEVLLFIELYKSKKDKIETLKAKIITELPDSDAPPKVYKTHLPGKKIKVAEYRNWLEQELQKITPANDNDEIIIE